MTDDGSDEKRDSGDLWITVVLPDGVPVLYPQAARVLCRIVVGLARKERGSEPAPRWRVKNLSGDRQGEWAVLDELLGMEALADKPVVGEGIGRLVFYGRCSTEDNQDPKTSLAWQMGEASRFVEPLGGQIVEQFFDIGQSRSLPWERRGEANRVLQALKDPNRGWTGLVVGEATRCWYGNQFSLTWPKFDRYGVSLWIPSLGGVFDPENTVHDMAMTITGGLSQSERQHVQRRVRAAMAAQVLVDGKHQGGRAPYGYQVVDAGPDPNPRKAQEGYRLRVLAIDELAAPTVERIFATYLDGLGFRAIAESLNAEAIPCPSAHNPMQNRHRRGDGWQGSTVRVISRTRATQGSRSTGAGRRLRNCWTRTMWPPGTSLSVSMVAELEGRAVP
jgi:DNA invertase Pin-like site-specific DNA recombinase